MQEHRDTPLHRLHLADGDLHRLLPGDDPRQQRLGLPRPVARQAMEQRHMRRHEVALRRVEAAAQRVEAGEGLAVHLQCQHEGRVSHIGEPV